MRNIIVLIDTNILLDVLLQREQFYKDSLEVLKLIEKGSIRGYIAANTVDNIFYVVRKQLGNGKAREVIQKILMILEVVSLNKKEILAALKLDISDFEDAIQTKCAMKAKSSYIITRNEKDFARSSIKAISPTDFLAFFSS